MDGEECVTMALDASIGERPYVDKYMIKITRKIGLEGWGQHKVLMSWKKCPSHL
jgi:hypothetical protein